MAATQGQRDGRTLLPMAASDATDDELVSAPPVQARGGASEVRRLSKCGAAALAVGLLACLALGGGVASRLGAAARVRGAAAPRGVQPTGLSEDDDWDDDDWDAGGDDWDGDSASDGFDDDDDDLEETVSDRQMESPPSAKGNDENPRQRESPPSSAAEKDDDDDDDAWADDTADDDEDSSEANLEDDDTADDDEEDSSKADDDLDGDLEDDSLEDDLEDDDLDDDLEDDDDVEEDSVEPVQDPEYAHCSDSGSDCTQTKCCSQPGEQCWTKNATWAICRSGCMKGRHVTEEDGKPWMCEELGDRTPGKAPKCSAFGENCANSHCCRDIGLQCYEKHAGYATCKPSCSEAKDPSDKDSDPWTCKELGTKKPGRAAWTQEECSEDWTDCSKTKCCKIAGSTCFQRDDEWASCQDTCTDESWTCKRLGPPMPILEAESLQRIVPKMKAAPWVKSECAAFGSNCMDEKCCMDAGAKCYAKNSNYASCKWTCVEGPDPADSDGSDDWSCREVGPRTPGEPEVHVLQGGSKASWVDDKCSDTGEDCSGSRCCKEEGFQCLKDGDKATCRYGGFGAEALGAATPKEWDQAVTFFCFVVVTRDTYEVDIMRNQLKRRAGIFACEDQAMMTHDEGWTLDDELGGEMVPFKSAEVGKSRDGTAGNAELFMNVWDAVKDLGKWKVHGWTIKSDPDAVLMPDRLRKSLAKVREDTHLGDDLFAYVKTCHKDNGMKNMMFGALEALTRVAVEKYFEGINRCRAMEWQTWGEDLFMMKCLDNLGAIGMDSFSIVSDDLCNGVDCGDPEAGVFHPMKDADSWNACFDQAIR